MKFEAIILVDDYYNYLILVQNHLLDYVGHKSNTCIQVENMYPGNLQFGFVDCFSVL